MPKDDEYIYSYIDKKMVKANDKHKFDNERYKNKKTSSLSGFGAAIVGIVLGIFVLSVMISKDIRKESSNIESSNVFKSILPKSNNKVEIMNNFLYTANSIVTESDEILNSMINTYSNKDFSKITKTNLENDLTKLKDYNLNQFKGEEYATLKNKLDEHINITKTCVEYYSVLNNQNKEASEYLNNLIGQKKTLDDLYIKDVKETLSNAGFQYEVQEDGIIKFY
ncbi:hypothetical protein R0131_13080 [Clostridium sp. AL.422]|uniref:hypothetical protein n=1 Tax=Clostridium TaxID=1485 RepID=UPI00293DBD36|nr:MULTISPECIES: hypothetical protein [unclassified Clostridium]MDV4151755.1 hypothetical protein [Clostridium sp. AL.422]